MDEEKDEDRGEHEDFKTLKITYLLDVLNRMVLVLSSPLLCK